MNNFFTTQPGSGGSGVIAGTVATFAALPTPVGDHTNELWYVTNGSGGFFSGINVYKYPKGLYSPNVAETDWTQVPINVKVSEDSLTLVDILNWTEFITYAFDIHSGDRIIYNSKEYKNITGSMTSTAPDVDTTNWSSEIVFNPEISPAYLEGKTFYNSEKKALSYYNDVSDITVNMGQELLFRVENMSGATIPNGSVVCPDTTKVIDLANAHFKDKSRIIAVMTHDIADGEMGYATKFGQVGGLDTSGYIAGQVVYLSATASGQFTGVLPTDGGYVVTVGVVDVVHTTEGVITVDTRSSDLTVEVTDTNGFPLDQVEAVTLSVNDTTRTFTISPDLGEFHFYERGEKYEKDTAQNVVWTDVEGDHWFYFNEGVLQHLENPTFSEKEHIILNHAFVAYIYWNATNKEHVFDIFMELHGISMSPYTHLYLHLTRGAQYLGGLSVGDILPDESGDLDTHAQFSITEGLFFDEDIQHTTLAKDVGDTWQVGFLSGVGADFRTGEQTGFALLNIPAGRPYYNQNNAGTWQLTEVGDRDFFLTHIFAVNGYSDQTLAVMGQEVYERVGDARAGATTEIANIVAGFELAESVPIATIIFECRNGYGNTVKARIRTTDEGENFIDWRTTELAQGTAPSSHTNLTNVLTAGVGITQGHVDNGFPFQLPTLTTVERDAVTASNGMICYNTTLNVTQIYENGTWITK